MDRGGKGVIDGRKAEQQGFLCDGVGFLGLGRKDTDVTASREHSECFGFQEETLELSSKRKILFRNINVMEVNFRSVGKVI